MTADPEAHAAQGAAEEVILAELLEAAEGRAKRARIAEGAVIVKAAAKRLAVPEGDIERDFAGHGALEVRDVRATRLFGFFKLTRVARGVALKDAAATVKALEAGARIPAAPELAAYCAAALAADDASLAEAAEFEGAFPARAGGPRSLGALSIGGEKRADLGGETAGGDAAKAKSLLSRLRRAAQGGGFELSERSRVNTPMAALEAVLQGPPELLAGAFGAERFEAWLRDDCKERELADIVTATRLRASVDRLPAKDAKRLFVRLLSFSPLREAVALGVVPAFVGKLTSAPEPQVEQMVAVLEGIGTEGVLESLIKAVFEVDADARPRVLMAMGAVGSPRVLEPLTRIALHSQVKADRVEAAAAVIRIASRHEGEPARAAREALAASADAEVRAMLEGRTGRANA